MEKLLEGAGRQRIPRDPLNCAAGLTPMKEEEEGRQTGQEGSHSVTVQRRVLPGQSGATVPLKNKRNRNLSYNPVISLLAVYPREIKT